MRNIIEIGIALLLFYITWQNYKINKYNSHIQGDKLRLDLFDKRYRVFKVFQKFFSVFRKEGTVTKENLFEFMADSSDNEFLFEDDIKIHRDKIRKNGLKLIQITRRLENQKLEVGEKRSKYAGEAYELEKWFEKQVEISIGLFKPYLHFSIYKKPLK